MKPALFIEEYDNGKRDMKGNGEIFISLLKANRLDIAQWMYDNNMIKTRTLVKAFKIFMIRRNMDIIDFIYDQKNTKLFVSNVC